VSASSASIAFTPQLRAWIVEHVDRGVPPAALVRSLVEDGLAARTAEALVATLWAARATGASLPDAIDARQAEAARFRHEAPRLPAGNSIATADRRVRVALRLERPCVAVLDDVLARDECEQLVALAQPRLRASTIVDPGTGEDVASLARSSQGMFFRPQENALVQRIDARLAQLMNLPVANGEGLQVLRYEAGAHSAPHFDFLMPTNDANQASLQRSGQRVSTLVMYLNDPPEGGETVFPEAGITVAPRLGSALYFEYCNSAGQLDPLSLHAGLPVRGGTKWVATRWMRQQPFRPAA
jgi:prolyl 4-hydroxylase